MSKQEPWYKSEWFQTLKIIFFIALGILFVGYLFQVNKDTQKIIQEDESVETKLKRLNKEIEEIEAQKLKYEKRLQKILFYARLLVAVLIVLLNVFYVLFLEVKDFIGSIVNFNSFILLLYSFIAFVSYGSIQKFKDKLEEVVKVAFGSNHVALLFKLHFLKIERDKLMNEKP
jgi:hypothetical protein